MIFIHPQKEVEYVVLSLIGEGRVCFRYCEVTQYLSEVDSPQTRMRLGKSAY